MTVELWERTALIRSKNAGPFELTFDVIFADDEAYAAGCRHRAFTPEGFAALYGVDPAQVRVFRKDRIRAIKVSIPRPAVSGDPDDGDVFGGQLHAPLVRLPLDVPPAGGGGDDASHVRSLLPEIGAIADERLREQVAAIWVECWRESAWERIEDVPKHPGLPPGRDLVAHVRSVTQQALAAADIVEERHGIAADRDTLLAAGLLHDVSKLLEYEPDGSGGARASSLGRLSQHATYGAHKAWEKGLADEIVHVILTHTHTSNTPPRTLEGLILHYVDYLDTDALLFDAGGQLDLHLRW